MSRNPGRGGGPDPGTNEEPPASTASDDRLLTDELGEPRTVDQSDDIPVEREDDFSWTGPEVYFPLLIGGLLLVSFPDPVTSLVGLVSIAIGLLLAGVDLLSRI